MRSLDVPYQTDLGLSGELHLRQFEHMSELVDLGATVDQETRGYDRYMRESLIGAASFAGSVSLGATVELGRQGWPEGTEKIAKIVDSLSLDTLRATSRQPELYHDVVGEEPDVGAFLSGEPENMINWYQPPEDGTRMIEFVINAGASVNVSPEQIMTRGAGIVAAAQALEANGHSVGITAAFPFRSRSGGRQALCHYVPLAIPGRYFDLDTVTFGLSHPSVLRRLVFAAMEEEPDRVKNQIGIYRGGPYGFPDKVRFLPHSEYKGIILSDGYGSEPLELAQDLIDFATGRKEVEIGQFNSF